MTSVILLVMVAAAAFNAVAMPPEMIFKQSPHKNNCILAYQRVSVNMKGYIDAIDWFFVCAKDGYTIRERYPIKETTNE